jgi:Amt family ammonium transporter
MNLAVCLLCIVLVPLATAGLALIHQGLGRSRSAAHAMFATLCALSVTAIVFVFIGFSWAGYAGGAAHTFHLVGKDWNLLGAEPFFAASLNPAANPAARQTPAILFAVALQIFSVGIASLIPISAGSDRWRLGAICASSALLAAVFYPLFSHWVWGMGWLADLTNLFGLPPFVDGGAGAVQVIGGLTALSVAWVLGPRQGKYADGNATAIPGHHIVFVLFGCLLALAGWIGLDAAIAMIFYGVNATQVAAIAIDAMLSAAGGCLAAVAITQWRYRKPDASLSANGWIAGLVAGSAGCGLVTPLAAVVIGLIAGALVTLLVETLELRLYIDDPGGAVSVHAGAGLWGLLAFGFFGPANGARGALILSQLVGIATLLGLMLPLIHLSHLVLNRFIRFRVDADGDWQGMDIRELGAGAYPEFVIHADEFVPR